jgi:pentatricopeptide repeat protein
MQERNVQIDTLILNTILSTGVAAGKTEPAEALLHEMAKTNPKMPDVISYNTVLKGYAHQKTADKALTILNAMLERGVRPNGITFNTVMDAAVRCAQVEDAWKVLDQMRKAGIQPDKYTCTILMKGLHEESTPKQLSNVLEMLQLALPQCDAALRSSLFRGIIQVAARLNNTSLLLQAFRQMRDQNVSPTSNDFQIVIQSLAQQGNTSDCSTIWQNVLKASTSSRQQNDISVIAIFTAVMEDFSKKDKVEGMICAFESLRTAVSDGIPDLQKSAEAKELQVLLQQCRAALMQAASRKQHSSPACRRLLELAPEHGLSLDSLILT